MSSSSAYNLIECSVSFPEFVLRIACDRLRDTKVVEGGPLGVQIPKAKAVVRYRSKIRNMKAKLKTIESMTAHQRLRWAAKEARETFKAEQAEHRKSLAEKAGALKKHEAMLKQIETWAVWTRRTPFEHRS